MRFLKMSYLDFVDLDVYLLRQNERIIHQIWFGTIPTKREAKKAYDKLKIYRDSWVIKNPTWCRIEWNKKLCMDLIKTFYPEHMDMFKKYKYEIQRCDMIRYLILHRYGGWYADMDYYCNRPLDEAMNKYKNSIYFVQSPNTVIGQDDDHISNSLMYSVRNHSFWRCVMLELEKAQKAPVYYSKHLEVMFTTGPAILNRVYSHHKYKYRVKSLPWKLFHPYGVKDEKIFLANNKEVYAIHIGKGSWEESDSKFFLFFLREWKIFLFIVCGLIIPYFLFYIKNHK